MNDDSEIYGYHEVIQELEKRMGIIVEDKKGFEKEAWAENLEEDLQQITHEVGLLCVPKIEIVKDKPTGWYKWLKSWFF